MKPVAGDQKNKIYTSAGITGKLGFGEKPGLLIIDMMKGFTRPDFQLGADLSLVIESTAILLNKVREAKLPVFFSICEYDQDLQDAGLFGRKIPSAKNLLKGSEQVEIEPRIAPQTGEMIISKKFPSCFFGTPLISYLIPRRVDTLIVAGATTSGCVRATVVDALQYGFRTIIPLECVGDRAAEPHEANLFDMKTKYADVVSLSEVLDYLNHLSESGGVRR